MSDYQPAIMCSDRRCSVQLQIEAATEAEALFGASARWQDATRRLGLTTWPVTRAEVLTLEEYLRDGLDPADRLPNLARPGRDGLPSAHAEDLLPRALQDSLTGLVNRELFADCVRSVLADSIEPADQWAVLVFDLDHFAALNRSEGAALADRLLAVLASRISRVPEHTMVARLGGDEFAVLVRQTLPGSVDQVATRLLETIRAPMELEGRRAAVSASVGIATSAAMSHPDDLIRDAAIAMCLAKADGGDCFRRFDPGVSVDVKRLDFDADPAPDRLAYVLLLERAALAANECQALADVASLVLQQVCTHTGWPLGRLTEMPSPTDPSGDNGEGREQPAIWHTSGPDRFQAFRAACDASSRGPGQGLAGRVRQTAKAVAVVDIADADVPPTVAAAASEVGVKSGFAFPILVGRDVVAILEFYSSRTGRINEALDEVLAGVCAQLGRVVERNRAQLALARSEEKYHLFADSVPVLMWMTGRDGMCTMFNRAWLEFTGRTLEQELGDGWLEAVHPDDRARCYAVYTAARQRREPVDLEYRLRRADGEYRIIFDRGHPIGDGDEFQGYVGGCIDVTERRRAEEALRDSESRLRALIATSGGMIVVMDADNKVLADYQGVPEGLGYPSGSTSGRTGWEFVHPDDLARTAEAFAATLAKPGLTEPVQCRIRHADGPWRWVEAVGNNLLDYPPVGGIVISAVDITELKELEATLAAAEERLRRGGDGATLGLWHWDPASREVVWSDEIFEIYGVVPGGRQLARDIASRGVHPADRARLTEIIHQVNAGKPMGPFDYRIIRPTGEVRRVRGRAMALRDGMGRIASVSGSIQDVTDTQPAEADVGHTGAA